MHFHIEGLPPYDGDHPIDLERFTNRELHLIKEMSGVRANELTESFQAGDNDLIVAFCAIALQRAGLTVDRDRLWDAEVGKIDLVVEDDAGPPARQPESGDGDTAKPASSGKSSRTDGGHLASVPSPTGTPGSGTGSGSVPATSAS